MASFYLDGKALEWYRWLFRNKQLVDWPHFAEKVRIRFKHKGLESAEGRFSKLQKITTISDLQRRFEAIAKMRLTIFCYRLMIRLSISGLREHIKNSILSHDPKTFDEALKKAHIQERRIQAEKGPID